MNTDILGLSLKSNLGYYKHTNLTCSSSKTLACWVLVLWDCRQVSKSTLWQMPSYSLFPF